MSRLVSLPTLLALAACTAPTADDAALVIVDEQARDSNVFVEVDGVPFSEALPVWVRSDDEVVLVAQDGDRELFLAPGEILVVRGTQAELSWFSAEDDLDPDAVAVLGTDEAVHELAELIGADGFAELDGLRLLDAPGALYAVAGMNVADVWETVPVTLAGEPLPGWYAPTDLRCACDLGWPGVTVGEPTTVTVVHEIEVGVTGDLQPPLNVPFFSTPLEAYVTDGGTGVRVIAYGDGPAVEPNHRVTVTYLGTLADGTAFDAADAASPVTFPLWGLIDGWREGLVGMRVGGRRQLVIPPGQAYGDREIPAIPANSTLIFDVELIHTEPEDAWVR